MNNFINKYLFIDKIYLNTYILINTINQKTMTSIIGTKLYSYGAADIDLTIITMDNINSFIEETYPNITEIVWEAQELDRSLLKKFPNLKELQCGVNTITSLEPVSICDNLQLIICNNNNISSLEPLSNCTKLQGVCCAGAQITSLDSLSLCVDLKYLYCANNQITSLSPLSACINLEHLCCTNNQIISLSPLSACVNLQSLYCCANQITSLDGLSTCVNLEDLICNGNQITSLDPISTCVNLKNLRISRNQIISLNSIIYLQHLNDVYCPDNPLEVPTIQVQRFLERIRRLNDNSSIYHDNQNIHDVTIQKSVCDSLQNLLKDSEHKFNLEMIINSPLDDKTKNILIEYCQDESVHSIHLITYFELLGYVWNRIVRSNHENELFKILQEQISDSECRCFTGRFNRTLSVLVGFFDDIKVEISDNSRIGAIILLTKDQIIPYNVDVHKKLALKRLQEVGYSAEEAEPWIEAIDD